MTKKILLITDAWRPQVNGVVTTLTNVVDRIRQEGHEVTVFSPDQCPIRFPLPGYSEIVLGIPRPTQVAHHLDLLKPDHVHISTPEGPLGQIFRIALNRRQMNYTTAYHTKFPEFVNAKFNWVPVSVGHKFMKSINSRSKKILVPTQSMVNELEALGYENVKLWSRGYDTGLFKPDHEVNSEKIFVCVSRVSVEKNLEDFFRLDLPGRKIMVGDGPQRKKYENKYRDVQFVGSKSGTELARYYQKADVFVFPSRTDTYGVVMLESIACGTPVAAYDVTGPRDVITNGLNGYLGEDLEKIALSCLDLNRQVVHESSKIHTWEKATQQFMETLVEV